LKRGRDLLPRGRRTGGGKRGPSGKHYQRFDKPNYRAGESVKGKRDGKGSQRGSAGIESRGGGFRACKKLTTLQKGHKKKNGYQYPKEKGKTWGEGGVLNTRTQTEVP